MMEQSNDEDPSRVKRKQGGPFEQRVAGEDQGSLNKEVSVVITKIIKWPSYSQSIKGVVTSGVRNSWRYVMEKWEKNREGQKKGKEKDIRKPEDSGPAQTQKEKSS